ncbi:MAG: zf-HC2 domain-containing protein [Planctomycetota bacterium]|jgi:predicted anti-sigma-YlaC factor YlaD
MMTEEYCQKVRISAMAILDGEAPLLSAGEIAEHAESCADCRQELERQKQVLGLLNEQ